MINWKFSGRFSWKSQTFSFPFEFWPVFSAICELCIQYPTLVVNVLVHTNIRRLQTEFYISLSKNPIWRMNEFLLEPEEACLCQILNGIFPLFFFCFDRNFVYFCLLISNWELINSFSKTNLIPVISIKFIVLKI